MFLKNLFLTVLNLFLLCYTLQAQSKYIDVPTAQKLSLNKFIHVEKKKGASIETSDPEAIAILSEEAYPYINKYDIAQPFQGIRVVDSTKILFKSYFTKLDSTVKYLSFKLSPEKRNLQNLLKQLEAEGRTSEKEISQAIQDFKKDPRVHNHNSNIYLHLVKSITNELGKPQIIPDDNKSAEHTRLFWKNKHIRLILGYEGLNKKKHGVIMHIYWE